MEINATIYAVAKKRETLEEIREILAKGQGSLYFSVEVLEPSIVLPLSQVWYGGTAETGMTSGAESWRNRLQKCADLLGTDGAVVIVFRSPDHPDTYQEYASTTVFGGVDISERSWSTDRFKRKKEITDIEEALTELMSGRSAGERRARAGRAERWEARRAEKGDFEIVHGVLKKYRGDNEQETVPAGVTEIASFAFVDQRAVERFIMECEDFEAPPLEKLVIPEGVRILRDYALAYCQNLEEVSLPDGVEVIGERAFEGCENLKHIVLPGSLTEIADYTFFLCWELRSAELPEGIRKIGEGAFQDCYSLKKIRIPQTLEEIGPDAFMGCDELKKVILPEGLKRIGANAFKDCENLEEVVLPKSLTEMDDSAFDKTCRLIRK